MLDDGDGILIHVLPHLTQLANCLIIGLIKFTEGFLISLTHKLPTLTTTTQLRSNIILEGIVREPIPKYMGNLALVEIDKLSNL